MVFLKYCVQVSTHQPCHGQCLVHSWSSQQSQRTRLRWTGSAMPCSVSVRRSQTLRREGWTPASTHSRCAARIICLFVRGKKTHYMANVKMWHLPSVTSTLCLCTDGPSLSGLHLVLQLGQTLLQGVCCFPLGECPHLSDFTTHSLVQLLCLVKSALVKKVSHVFEWKLIFCLSNYQITDIRVVDEILKTSQNHIKLELKCLIDWQINSKITL